MPLSLKEPVDVFYQSLGGSTRKNFKQFSDAMGQEYNPPEKYIYMRRSELYSLKQEGKALDKYVNQLEKLALEAGLYWSRYIEGPVHQWNKS